MRFLEFPDIERTPDIVDGMIEDIAWRERESREHFAQDLLSKHLGKMCVTISDALEAVDEVRIPLSDDAPHEQVIYRQLRGLIIGRADPAVQKKYQQSLHTVTIGGLERIIQPRSKDQRGKLAEYVGLALLTRYAHPSMLAYPALSHHELDDDVGGHYDVGVVSRRPNGGVDSNFLQIKSMCLGSCGLPYNKKLVEKYQNQYRPIVQMVSACCDLGIPNYPYDHSNIPRLLVRERQNEITPKEVKTLDNLSDRLLLNMSADLLPRGALHKGSINIGIDFLTSR